MNKSVYFPLLPLRDIVVFPNMVIPLFVGRDKSIKALNEVMKTNKKIILVTQKNAEIDDPNPEDIYSFGCESKVLQLLKLPDGTVKVLAEGLKRVKILEYKTDKEYLESSVEIVEDEIKNKEDLLALSIAMVRKLEKLTNLNKKLSLELMSNLKELKDPSRISDHVAGQLNISISEKQKLLETLDLKVRLEKLMDHINNEINVISVEKRIRGRVKNQMEKTQREYYLNEQMKAIQKELGESEDGKDEIAHLQKLIIKAKMTKEATKKCLSELKKLKSMSSMSAEATVVRNYLDWMVELPWYSKDKKIENISIPDASMLTIQVWDTSLIKTIENAIMESNLGINPQTEGQLIRLSIPKLSEERRNELAKVALQYSENAKIAIRNIRREIMDNLKKDEKDKKISQDELKKNSSKVQEITDEYILKVDSITLNKQTEILKV